MSQRNAAILHDGFCITQSTMGFSKVPQKKKGNLVLIKCFDIKGRKKNT